MKELSWAIVLSSVIMSCAFRPMNEAENFTACTFILISFGFLVYCTLNK